jgi:hypothetical protein
MFALIGCVEIYEQPRTVSISIHHHQEHLSNRQHQFENNPMIDTMNFLQIFLSI